MNAVSIEQAWLEAQAATEAFLEPFAPADRLVVFYHFDADGLAAGALFGRGLARLGFTSLSVVPSGRGESAFSESARGRLRALEPAGLIVTDLGVNSVGVLNEVPTLYVDHHQPNGTPENATIVSGYAWYPIPCSAWLAYELLASLTPMDDLTWLAAVGTISDLGDRAPWPRLGEAKKRYTAKWLKEAVALVNAARRAPAFDIRTPLELLLHADGPKALATDEAGGEKLRAYQAEVNAALKEAHKAAPTFSQNQPYALLKLDSPAQIHPLIAQQWRGRLPNYAVIAANTGYLPDTVAFSVRTARSDLNLPALLQQIDLGAPYPSYGHDQASGGHLPPEAFNRLLTALGFGPPAHLSPADTEE